MLQLYYAPHTCALASHIALEEAGAPYATVRMSFQSEDQKKAGYMKINPKARVPSLVTDKGILTETPAILAFIAQAYPAAKLAPVNNPFEFARELCSGIGLGDEREDRGRLG